MKKLFLLLVVVLSLSGCAQSYVMKLNNGRQIVTASKPRLKGANYYYKDARGQVNSVPVGRVIEVLPASMAEEEKPRFRPSVQ